MDEKSYDKIGATRNFLFKDQGLMTRRYDALGTVD